LYKRKNIYERIWTYFIYMSIFVYIYLYIFLYETFFTGKSKEMAQTEIKISTLI